MIVCALLNDTLLGVGLRSISVETFAAISSLEAGGLVSMLTEMVS